MIAKALPNALSLLRLVLSPALLVTEPTTVWFYLMYLCCGATDVVDGFLARKLDAVSKSGKALDLAADIVFAIVVLLLIFWLFDIPLWVTLWIVAIAIVRLSALLMSYVRIRVIFTHSYLDRAAGVMLFLFLPVTLFFHLEFSLTAGIVCAVASLATLDLLVISLLAKRSDTNVYSSLRMILRLTTGTQA